MSDIALHRLKACLGPRVLDSHDHRGDETAAIGRESLRSSCLWLRDQADLRFEMLTDLTAVDYLEQGRTPRFDVVYHLHSISLGHRIRIKVGLAESDNEVDSVSDIWRNANWLEREVWDMYGIRFRNHPDMRRILLYEQFEGHPLRKDYPKERRQPLVRRPQHEIDEVVGRRPGQRSSLL